MSEYIRVLPSVYLLPHFLPLVNGPHFFNHKTSQNTIKSTSYPISLVSPIFQTAMYTSDSNPSIHHLTRSDFDNPEVFNAINPHPMFGYFHGKQVPRANQQLS